LALPFLQLLSGPAEAADSAEEARALNKRGEELIVKGRIHEAIQLFEKMLEQCGPRKYCRAVATFYLGRCRLELGEYDEALRLLDKAGSYFRHSRRENEQAIVNQTKARVYAERSQYRKSLSLFYNAADVFSRLRNKDALFDLLVSTCAVHSFLGLSDNAMRCSKLAERLLPPKPPPQQLAVLSNNTGLGMLGKQDYAGAQESFEKALSYFQQVEHAKGIITSLANLGAVLEAKSEYSVSAEALGKSLTMARETKYPRGEAVALNNLGNVRLKTGDYGPALKLYESSLRISTLLDVKQLMGEALNNIGLVRMILGEYQKASENFKKAYVVCSSVGALTSQAWALHNTAFVAKDQGAFSEALNCLRRAIHLADKTGDRRLKATATLRLGNLEEYKGLFDDAQDRYTSAEMIQREIGDLFFRADTLTDIANMHVRKGDFGNADQSFAEAAEIRRRMAAPIGGILCKHALSFLERARYESPTSSHPATIPADEKQARSTKAGHYISLAKQAVRPDNAHESWLLKYVEGRYLLDHDPKSAVEQFERLKEHAGSCRAGRFLFLGAVGLGLAQEKLGNRSDAEKAFAEAVTYADKIRETLPERERQLFLDGEHILGLKNKDAHDGLTRVKKISN